MCIRDSRIPEPSGIAVTAEQTPALFALIDDLRGRLQAPPIDRVLIGGTFNGSVHQIARAGGLLGRRNILAIGYPLFATLGPEHLRAVVAHEIGHLSRAHGRMAVWIYRTRHSWWRLSAELRERGVMPIHVRLLYRWYLPRLDRHAMAICREHERLADRAAATAAGSQHTAETLIAVDAAAWHIGPAFWDAVDARVGDEPEPPRPYAELSPRIWQGPAAGHSVIEWLLDRETSKHDSHPSLRDRLYALDLPARLPDVVGPTAAEVYLGAAAAELAGRLDDDWQNERREEWHRLHQETAARRARLQSLSSLAQPSSEERFERAELVERFDGAVAAQPIYRDALAAGSARAGLAIGRHLLAEDDPAGVAAIEQAMTADPSLIPEGCGLLMPFLERHRRLLDMHRFTRLEKRHRASVRQQSTSL